MAFIFLNLRCHIGQSVEISIEMLEMLANYDVSDVVATPHFYANHDTPERFLKRRAEAWSKLRAAMPNESELPKIILQWQMESG